MVSSLGRVNRRHRPRTGVRVFTWVVMDSYQETGLIVEVYVDERVL